MQLNYKTLEIDKPSAERGKAIDQRDPESGGCVGCHRLIDRKGETSFKAVMIPISETKTDPAMALNFADRTALTGKLEGTPVRFPFFIMSGFFTTFGKTTSGAEALGNAALDVYLGKSINILIGAIPDPATVLGNVDQSQVETVLQQLMNDKSPKYKARPLNGIWATAPYLHNGSVPNLEQLLRPANARDSKFYLGSRKFEPRKAGLSTEKDALRGFLFDASRACNRKTGHEHGTTLPEEEKRDLIEFLKTL